MDAYVVVSEQSDRTAVAWITHELADLRMVQGRFGEGLELAAAAAKSFRECGQAKAADECDQVAEEVKSFTAAYGEPYTASYTQSLLQNM